MLVEISTTRRSRISFSSFYLICLLATEERMVALVT